MVELIWDGKYDKDGKRVAPLRVKLPFQTVETVSESAQQRQLALDFGRSKQGEWRNRLIWGDKKYVLPSLLDEFAGKVDLIYIDPPFNVGGDFSFTATVPDLPETEVDETQTFVKEQSAIEQKAYNDTWGQGYAKWFADTALIVYELLSPSGSFYVHLDWHVGHSAKVILDEIFSPSSFRNEIIWKRSSAHSDSATMGNSHDIIFFYTKSDQFVWNQKFQAYDDDYIVSHYSKKDEKGRNFGDFDLSAKGLQGGGYWYEWNGIYDNWRAPIETMREYEKQGRLYYTRKGRPRYVRYLDEMPGMPLQDLWIDIPPVNSQATERVTYSTQKPEKLLNRIISMSSNEGGLILDCFAGSGTTSVAAEKLNRRWIACDLGRFAIHTTRKRLLSIPDVKPFIVQNLGKYERQTWQASEFGGKKKAEGLQKEYRNFIIELYSARPIEGYAWLHGIKDGRMVHVGSVDSPVAPNDLTQIAIEFNKAMGTGKDAPKVAAVDVLGWDFAFEINEIGIQQAAAAGVNVRCLKIPREVMDPKAVEQGDVKFFELAALSVKAKTKKQELELKLTDFTIPPDDVPEDVQKAIKHWSQWIDYWAVDWENKGDTFHNQWQTYRTRQDMSLKLETSHIYEEPGEYMVMVKVIDILGNDTTKTIKVKV